MDRTRRRKGERRRAEEKQKQVTGIVFGLLLITLGVIFTIDNLGRIEAGRIWSYWPLVLVAFGLPSLIVPKDAGDPVWGVLLVGLGSFFLLRKLDVIAWRFWDVWPLLLVLIGVTLIAQTLIERRQGRDATPPSLQNGGAS